MTRIKWILWLSLIAAFFVPSGFVIAQQMPLVDGHYFPLNQMTPPGTAAHWAAVAGRTTPEYFQPIRVSMPQGGVVTYYEGPGQRAWPLASPAQANLIVGRMYRMRLSDIPELPGVDFYPSIELIDRLHPPQDKVEQFPIEVEFTLEELEWAANDRLVTKVIYLEQPDRVPSVNLESKSRMTTIEPSRNAIAEADLLGRPMAIVRLGGRRPDPHQPEPAFFGPGGPIRVTSPTPEMARSHRPVEPNRATSRQVGVVKVGPRGAARVAQR